MTLLGYVKKYMVIFRHFEVWAPYWKNEPGIIPTKYSGKPSFEELQEETNKIAETYPDPIHNSEEARFLMLKNGLGVDCSGFVFHTLQAYLKEKRGVDLASRVYLKRDDLLDVYQKDSWQTKRKFSRKDILKMPEYVSIRQVCDWFGKQPQYITNVKRLCSKRATEHIKKVSDIKVGDMIKLKNHIGDHLGLIFKVKKSFIEFASSDYNPIGPGGIRYHIIEIIEPEADITKQKWLDLKLKSYVRVSVRRLRLDNNENNS